MNKALLYLVKGILLTPVFFLVFVNFKTYYAPICGGVGTKESKASLIAHLRHLTDKLEAGAAQDMQTLYPEGALFTYSLYGLAWANVMEEISVSSTLYQEGIEALSHTTEFLSSEEAKRPFTEVLDLPYGAFYQGWSTFVLGRKLAVLPPAQQDSIDIQQFRKQCKNIADAISTSEHPYLASYSRGTWPADNMICISALALHDQLFAPNYTALIQDWMQRIKAHLDPTTGLIPHDYNPGQTDFARGSSQSLMLSFLPAIDSTFARSQFKLYQQHFLTYRFGLPGIREYPKGTRGKGDIDAGPVLLGVGGAASVVGIRTMLMNGDCHLHSRLRNSVEGFGFPVRWRGKKKYLGGHLAIADAFIAWANSSNCNCAPVQISPPWTFHLYSLLTVFILSLMAYKI